MADAITAPETSNDITVFYASWCPYCSNLRSKLNAAEVDFDEVDVEQPGMDEVNAWIKSVNDGNRIVPTVLYSDGTHATNPAPTEVIAKLEQLKQ